MTSDRNVNNCKHYFSLTITPESFNWFIQLIHSTDSFNWFIQLIHSTDSFNWLKSRHNESSRFSEQTTVLAIEFSLSWQPVRRFAFVAPLSSQVPANPLTFQSPIRMPNGLCCFLGLELSSTVPAPGIANPLTFPVSEMSQDFFPVHEHWWECCWCEEQCYTNILLHYIRLM